MIICIYEPNASGFQCPLPLMHRALTRAAAPSSLSKSRSAGADTPDLYSAIKAKIKRDGNPASCGGDLAGPGRHVDDDVDGVCANRLPLRLRQLRAKQRMLSFAKFRAETSRSRGTVHGTLQTAADRRKTRSVPMSLEIIPTGAAVGAEIRGADLSQRLDANVFAEIEHAYNQYGVVFFRNQRITPEQQIAFTRRFGEIEFNIFGERWSVPGCPEIVVLSNINDDGKPIGVRRAGENWHSDMCYTARPPRGSMLYAHEIPTLYGLPLGDTEFASAAAAWDALPATMQKFLNGRRAVFDFRGRKRSLTPTQAEIERNPPVMHPIVRTHPHTGRRCLYVMRDDCTGIEGLGDQEAEALICALADHIAKPAFIYRHQWQIRDLLLWDNCTVQHRAIQDYDLPQRRLMHRTTMGGAIPI